MRVAIAATGVITTVAGSSATAGYGGDGGPAIAAQLSIPTGLSIDGQGDLYVADTLNQRVRAVGLAGSPLSVHAYGYDAVGNMTSNDVAPQRYDAANQLTAARGITYTFDGNGNQTQTSKVTNPLWRYDAQNHTQSYSDTLVQDAFVTTIGTQRQSKAVTSTLFGNARGTFDAEAMGLGLYRQTAPVSTTLYFERDPGGRLLALSDETMVYYYGLDGHGSVVNVTDRSGVVQNAYRYDPYGNSLSKAENASLANPWQYAGGYWDAETGLYLLGARYYAPRLGRFLQQDPAGSASDSQYAYVSDDPCNNSDPSGMKTCYHYASPQDIQNEINVLTAEGIALGLIGKNGTPIVGPLLGAGSVVSSLLVVYGVSLLNERNELINGGYTPAGVYPV